MCLVCPACLEYWCLGYLACREAGNGSGEDEEGWAVGDTVWVWDTDVPEKDAKEGEETWNVFKRK
jgi:hypothetical protein